MLSYFLSYITSYNETKTNGKIRNEGLRTENSPKKKEERDYQRRMRKGKCLQNTHWFRKKENFKFLTIKNQ